MNILELIRQFVNFIPFSVFMICLLLPPLISLMKNLGQLTNNAQIVNLATRAEIIVKALEQTGWANEDKKRFAIDKLGVFAKETKITVTDNQLDDYIENAVFNMKNGLENVEIKKVDK